jgi:hypothetical protein
MPPRIDIVMYRDPDDETSLWVYVDGVESHDHHVHGFDPGRGHQRSDVLDNREAMRADPDLPAAVRERCEQEFTSMLASLYVEGDDPRDDDE